MIRGRVILRADGNHLIGLGHIYRALAMVQMFRNEFECIFITRQPTESTIKLFSGLCEVVQLNNSLTVEGEINILKKYVDPGNIVILDGYHFGSEYQKTLKDFSGLLIAIDDKASYYFYADIIINPGDPSIALKYKSKPNAKILAGCKYAVLQTEFLQAARIARSVKKSKNLLVCMGGSDPFNVTTKVLKASLNCSFLEKIVVIVGSAYRYDNELEELRGQTNKNILIEKDISAQRIVAVFEDITIAICSASTVSLEFCCIKTGLIAGMVADNQQSTFSMLNDCGCIEGVKDLLHADGALISAKIEGMNDMKIINKLIQNQTKLMDGSSGDRIVHAINEFLN